MWLLAGLGLAGAGCSRPEVQVYEIPKETEKVEAPFLQQMASAGSELPPGHPPVGEGAPGANAPAASAAPSPPAGMPGGMPSAMPPGLAGGTPEGPRPTWTAPAHWQPGKSSSVRLGSYRADGPDGAAADIAITSFPGDVGGMVANLNRWRGQIGLGPVGPEEASGLVQEIAIGDLPGLLSDFTGPSQRTVVGWFQWAGRSWFFKMTGPPATVESEKPAFLELLRSITLPAL